ncbi:MAG: sigma 54 modulation/S30EA ribosomal C-terminal domain-containing protein [Oscillospiraceae bacterium]
MDALDDVAENLFQQIIKNKSKLESRMRAQAFENLEPEDAAIEAEHYELVKRKKFPVHAMEIDEAILQMNMLEHEFFLFENVETGELNIVYCRHGGDYGLIEPIR